MHDPIGCNGSNWLKTSPASPILIWPCLRLCNNQLWLKHCLILRPKESRPRAPPVFVLHIRTHFFIHIWSWSWPQPFVLTGSLIRARPFTTTHSLRFQGTGFVCQGPFRSEGLDVLAGCQGNHSFSLQCLESFLNHVSSGIELQQLQSQLWTLRKESIPSRWFWLE